MLLQLAQILMYQTCLIYSEKTITQFHIVILLNFFIFTISIVTNLW